MIDLVDAALRDLMLAAVVVYLIAGIIKGALGIGFPTVAISLMAQFTDARTAITLVVIPMMVTNAWQVFRSRQVRWVFQRFWLLLLVMLLFIGIFSLMAADIPEKNVTLFLGVIVTLYAASSLYRPVIAISEQRDKPAQIVTGVLAGIMGGIVSVWAPPVLIYLSARRLKKEQFVSTVGVLLFLGSCVLFGGYWKAGLLGASILSLSVLLVLPSLLGFRMGEIVRGRLSDHRFERLLLWFFLLVGINLIRRAIIGGP
ncbi:MAG: sulfite exporter TauE/SafE family protein [Granulosicoccus sp.]